MGNRLVATPAVLAAALGAALMTPPAARADPPYANCKAAAKDGRYNIPRGDPAYGQWLDRGNDGMPENRTR
ncbi:calcium-binding protein [Mycobacterium ahvazicum]|uniref:Calcium-binding protein n=1 Tax=Mycobacterium ahvazicum TaxID=1964395 RepID=A0A2K4YIY5_9MYCO|nr:excalibur calcium-binding domain-containing protein [Mycobacterium ahvazicum]SOX56751.1 calcium-binding protein [Mycobacterium ahvazicum]